jgi:hypothetical protein
MVCPPAAVAAAAAGQVTRGRQPAQLLPLTAVTEHISLSGSLTPCCMCCGGCAQMVGGWGRAAHLRVAAVAVAGAGLLIRLHRLCKARKTSHSCCCLSEPWHACCNGRGAGQWAGASHLAPGRRARPDGPDRPRTSACSTAPQARHLSSCEQYQELRLLLSLLGAYPASATTSATAPATSPITPTPVV